MDMHEPSPGTWSSTRSSGRCSRSRKSVAYRVVGDAFTAEDLAAEAFVRLYARWARMRLDQHRTAWILRVTANLAIDTARRKRPAV